MLCNRWQADIPESIISTWTPLNCFCIISDHQVKSIHCRKCQQWAHELLQNWTLGAMRDLKAFSAESCFLLLFTWMAGCTRVAYLCRGTHDTRMKAFILWMSWMVFPHGSGLFELSDVTANWRVWHGLRIKSPVGRARQCMWTRYSLECNSTSF